MMRLFPVVVVVSVLCGCITGSKGGTNHCAIMIACDNALAEETNLFTSLYPEGDADPTYGDGGSCFEVDKDACNAACSSAVDGMVEVATDLVSSGDLEEIPRECL